MKRRFFGANPMLKQETLQAHHNRVLAHKEVMTVSSTLKKSLCGLFVTLLTVAYIWKSYRVEQLNPSFLKLVAVICGIMVVGLAMAVHANPLRAKYAIFPYAILQGVLLGFISKVVEMFLPGLAFQAFLGTCIVFIIVAFISVNNIIKVTNNMRKRIGVMVLALFLLYSISFILQLLGIYNPFDNLIYGFGWLSIFFSLGVIILASFCLLADMDMIKQGAKNRYSSAIEWYCAMALLATVLWIYVEVLHLLIKLSRKRR